MQFLQNSDVLKIQKFIFSKNKKTQRGPRLYLEFTLRELIHFYRDLKNGVTPKNIELLMEIYNRNDFLPKTKMVRMVHMNIFYRMDLEFCDPKSEFWTKTENGSCSSISQFKTESKWFVFQYFSVQN